MQNSIPTQQQLSDRISIGAGCVALILTLAVSLAAPPAASPDIPALIVCGLLIAASGVLVFDVSGGYVSLTNLLVVSSLLMFGPAPALWVTLIGTALADVVLTVLAEPLHFPPRTGFRTLVVAATNVTFQIFSLTVGWLVYSLAGGRAPLRDINVSSILLACVLFISYFITNNLLFSINLKIERGEPIRETFWRDWQVVLLLDLLPLPLSLVLTNIYANLGLWTLMGFAIFLLAGMVGIHILNQAQTAAEQRVRELTSLAAISQAVHSSLDLPELLTTIYQQIRQMMNADNFYIGIYDPTANCLNFPLVYENGQRVQWPSREPGNSLAGLILRTQKPLLIGENLPVACRQFGVEMTEAAAESWLGVPIVLEDKVMGLMVAYSPTQKRAYNAGHLSVLSTVASQTALALGNIQLYNATRQRATELAILNSVSTTLSSSLDIKQVAQVIVDSIGPVIGCEKSAFFLINDSRTHLDLFASKGLTPEYIQKAMHLPIGPGERGMVAYTRLPILIPDVHADASLTDLRAMADAEGFRAVAEVPLIAHNEITGTLAVYYEQPRQFTQAELDLLSTFANQAAAAVANARLYARTDQALARRVEELSVMAEIGRELTITLDAKRIIDRMLERVMEVIAAKYGVVILFDAALEEARLLAYRGYPHPVMAPLLDAPWPLHQGISGRVLRTGRTANVPNVHADPDYYAAMPDVQSQLSVPIRSEDHVMGVITLESDRPDAFDTQAVLFIEHLSNQAAIALTNARLYEEAQRRLRETSMLYDASQQLTGILDIKLLAERIVANICKALDATGCLLEFWDRHTDTLQVIASYTAPNAAYPVAETPYVAPSHSREYPATARMLHSREPLIAYVGDPHSDAAERRLLEESHQQAALTLPLVTGDTVIGILECLDERPRRFSRDEIRLAQTLANQAAIAVENARLFHEHTRRLNELSQLYRASLALSGSLEPHEILDTISTISREITASDGVVLYLYDAATDSFQVGSTYGMSAALSDPQTIRPNGITRRIVQEQRTLLIADTHQEAATNPLVIQEGWRAAIYAPIISKNQVLGVLIVASRRPNAYTEEEARLISALASQAAVSIENSRLFQRVAEGRNRLQATLNSASEGILMFDLKGRISMVNPMLESLWRISRQALEGYTLEELLNRPALKIADKLGLPPMAADPFKQLQQKIRDTYQLPPPSLRFIERTTTPVLDQEDRLVGWMVTLRDVTEERELQQMRDNLTSMIVHDLRGPLGAIQSGLTMLGEITANLPDADFAREVIEVAGRSTRKLLTLVDSLLDISKGQLQLKIAAVDLQQLVKNVVTMLAPVATENGIILSAQLPPDLPLVAVDEEKIGRVLTNLLDNALKFTPAGRSVVVLAQVIEGDRPHVRCAVRDAGPGIPPEYTERIFDRFVQVPHQNGRRQGTGLGLAFCKLAVEAHGERIWVESAPGAGSTFYFTLPIYAL